MVKKGLSLKQLEEEKIRCTLCGEVVCSNGLCWYCDYNDSSYGGEY